MNFSEFLQQLRSALGSITVSEADAKAGPEIGADGVNRVSKNWKPYDVRRRIEIMVTGDPMRVGVVADAIEDVQKKIFGDRVVSENLETRITAFLDNCIHRTKWSKKPFKAAQQARDWHCEQTKTRFKDAFDNSRGEMVDAIILIGHRFDDEMQAALASAEQLKEQGVQIHCFHTGNDTESRTAYEKLASATGGIFMQLPDQNSIGQIMPILMAHFNSEEGMMMLNASDPEAQKLMRLLLEQSEPKKPETDV